MSLLWILGAVVTIVVAEDTTSCIITGNRSVTTFDNATFFINYPCKHFAAVMCLQDENQECQTDLYIEISYDDATGSFISNVYGTVRVTSTKGVLSISRFTLNATNLKHVALAFQELNDSMCFELVDDNTTVSVSFRNKSGPCVPAFRFRPQGYGGDDPRLSITLGNGVVSLSTKKKTPSHYVLCEIPESSNDVSGLTDQQRVLYYLLKHHLLQRDDHSTKTTNYFDQCRDDGSKALAAQNCEQHTQPTTLSCYKENNDLQAAEVLAYCLQNRCGNEEEQSAARDWAMGLHLPADCPVSLE